MARMLRPVLTAALLIVLSGCTAANDDFCYS